LDVFTRLPTSGGKPHGDGPRCCVVLSHQGWGYRRMGSRTRGPYVMSGDREVVIELSSAQVDRVLRQAVGSGNMSIVLSGLDDLRSTLETPPRQLADQRLSRSLLCGLLVLAAFPADGGYLGNADLARSLDINMSTAHRYIQTLLAVGLIEQHPGTRKYRLVQ
jgi:hypothetical protein